MTTTRPAGEAIRLTIPRALLDRLAAIPKSARAPSFEKESDHHG